MNDQLAKLFGPNFKLKDIEISQKNDNLGMLNTNIFDNNKIFRYLKSELELYYKEKPKPQKFHTLHPEKSVIWKEHFYLNLQALLNEVTFTSDSQIKTYLLDKVYKWYAEKSQRPLEAPKTVPVFIAKPEIEYPLILQNIESTISPVKPKIFPNIPKVLNLEREIKSACNTNPSRENFFTSTANDRIRKSRRLFHPYSKSQGDPVIIDFRTSSIRGSPEALRSTNITERENIGRTVCKEGFEVRVPFMRRDQMKEVASIKKRLSTRQVSLPFKVLESGLVFSDFTQEIFPAKMLPKGGELLIKDSWPKAASKKKKKKGKKKK